MKSLLCQKADVLPHLPRCRKAIIRTALEWCQAKEQQQELLKF